MKDVYKRQGLTREDKVCADSAEPKSIADYNKYGVKTFPARKGPKSVRYGTKSVSYTHLKQIGKE